MEVGSGQIAEHSVLVADIQIFPQIVSIQPKQRFSMNSQEPNQPEIQVK